MKTRLEQPGKLTAYADKEMLKNITQSISISKATYKIMTDVDSSELSTSQN